MPATVDQIEAALLAPFLSVANGGTGAWTATDYVAYENVDFEADKRSEPFIAVVTNGGRSDRVGVSNVEFGNPTVTISAFTPLGTGKATARQLLDTAAAIYRDVHFEAGTSNILAYSFSAPVELPHEGWFRLSQQISFKLF